MADNSAIISHYYFVFNVFSASSSGRAWPALAGLRNVHYVNLALFFRRAPGCRRCHVLSCGLQKEASLTPALKAPSLPVQWFLQLHASTGGHGLPLTPPCHPPSRPFVLCPLCLVFRCRASCQRQTHLPPKGGAPVSPLFWRSALSQAHLDGAGFRWSKGEISRAHVLFPQALFGPQSLQGGRKNGTLALQTYEKGIKGVWSGFEAALVRRRPPAPCLTVNQYQKSVFSHWACVLAARCINTGSVRYPTVPNRSAAMLSRIILKLPRNKHGVRSLLRRSQLVKRSMMLKSCIGEKSVPGRKSLCPGGMLFSRRT